MNLTNPAVDFYFEKENPFQKSMIRMREIPLQCGLQEVLKWGCPCYQLNGKNVVLIQVFKEYCAYLFFKGALLHDETNKLIQQSEHTQATRQFLFTSSSEVSKQQTLIKQYIYEAIEIEQAGLTVTLKKTTEYNIPAEFQVQLNAYKKLKKAFEALTPGRQRAYLLFFASAKLAKTREARIQKHIPDILAGKGLND